MRKLKSTQLHRHICKAASKADRALQERQETSEVVWQKLVNKAIGQVNRRYEALNLEDLETIHDLRIAFKKLRYLKEAAAGPQKNFPALKAFQDKMGEVQDWEVLLKTIHDYANRKGEGTFRKLTPLRKAVLLKRNRAVREFWKVRGVVLQWKGNGVL